MAWNMSGFEDRINCVWTLSCHFLTVWLWTRYFTSQSTCYLNLKLLLLRHPWQGYYKLCGGKNCIFLVQHYTSYSQHSRRLKILVLLVWWICRITYICCLPHRGYPTNATSLSFFQLIICVSQSLLKCFCYWNKFSF